MTNREIEQLALSLLSADTEADVIAILQEYGFWDDPSVWRPYGDTEGNFATIGNQQSRPEAALVEKIVNSVDARLMNECLIRGIDPTSADAPPSIRHAVARFFEDRDVEGEVGGLLQEWPHDRQLHQSRFITVAVTGATAKQGRPCITIADMGEGQTPSRMKDTFLSLDRSNKQRIPFVQGKFNMGGTGALKFCGTHCLQLIISRRNPTIVALEGASDPSASCWGLTVVRREPPRGGPGDVIHSVFKYLAPQGAERTPGRGDILAFTAPSLRAMPEQNRPYARDMEWGSIVKLYEYDMKGFRSHALRKDGLLFRLEILLPGIALPVRVHECRDYRGSEARSFANTLVGLNARLAENRGENLEHGYPTSVSLRVRDQPMTAQIFAFKDGRADTYRTNEGIIFAINGQTHGAIPKTFYSRSKVKMGRLASSLLVVVDCSKLSVVAREDLFMNSRDRLSSGELRKLIEEELEELIGKHPGLRELRERRRQQDIAHKLEDSKPLEDVLQSILRASPTLERLFLLGQRLNRPLPGQGHGATDIRDTDHPPAPFVGRLHPTFFRFHKRGDSEALTRTCEIGRRCRIKFETDVENAYFSRPLTPGRYIAEVVEGAPEGVLLDHSLTLHDGIANWSINLDPDLLTPGDTLTIQCTVVDDTLVSPFVNLLRLRIVAPSSRNGAGGGERERRYSDANGSRPGGRADSADRTLSLPAIVKVRRGDDNWQRHGFDERTACKVVEDASTQADDRSQFTFYVNVDNLYLRTEMKSKSADIAATEAKFIYANVLVGLALIHDARSAAGRAASHEEHEPDVGALVDATTRALGPFLLPMIDFLGGLSFEDDASLAVVGDDE